MARANYLSLDVGTKRIGVALANGEVRIAQPLLTLANDITLTERLQELMHEHEVGLVVVGLPRGMEGQATAQTSYTEAFVQRLQADIKQPIVLQDEALTSLKAETELTARAKPFNKGDVDALAATYILEDYLAEHQETN